MERKYRIGTRKDSAIRCAGEVDSKEGKSRIGYGVDKPAHHFRRWFCEGVVIATEWDNLLLRVGSRHPGQLIRMESGAGDHMTGCDRSVAHPQQMMLRLR